MNGVSLKKRAEEDSRGPDKERQEEATYEFLAGHLTGLWT